MKPSSPTPSGLTIQPRDLAFCRDAPVARWWLANDPVGTVFYNALSATFPQGERFFMDAVRRYRAEAPPPLSGQIAAFLSQEALHTREHLVFNHQIADNGFDVTAMEARTKATLDLAREQDPLFQLAATVALEHFTAILARAILSDERHLSAASPEARALWRWHAIEEIEHKAVAFDTFMIAARPLTAFRRWRLRVGSMIMATSLLISTVGRNMAGMFATAELSGAGTWTKVVRFLWAKPGILRQLLGEYLAYFAPGFHPWRQDDRALAEQAAGGLLGYSPDSAAA